MKLKNLLLQTHYVAETFLICRKYYLINQSISRPIWPILTKLDEVLTFNVFSFINLIIAFRKSAFWFKLFQVSGKAHGPFVYI